MTFPSVYEMFTPLSTVSKLRFWDWFSGDDLNSIWNKTNFTGTNTFQMSDTIDGGFEIITQAVSNARAQINFNGIEQYGFDGSIIIGITERLAGSSAVINMGFKSGVAAATTNAAFLENSVDNTFIRGFTQDGATGTSTNTSIANTTNPIGMKIQTKASSVDFFLNGILETTNSTNLPTIAMQPIFLGFSNGVSRTMRIRYIEAFNT